MAVGRSCPPLKAFPHPVADFATWVLANAQLADITPAAVQQQIELLFAAVKQVSLASKS